MGITAHFELRCSGCGKKLKLKGRVRQTRRSSYTEIPDLYEITWDSGESTPANSIEIRKGFDFWGEADGNEMLYCSIPCVTKAVEKMLPKLRILKDE